MPIKYLPTIGAVYFVALFLTGCSKLSSCGSSCSPSGQDQKPLAAKITYMVPKDVVKYKDAIHEHLYGENSDIPPEAMQLVVKSVEVPKSEDPIFASAEAAAKELQIGGSAHATVFYLKQIDQTAYVQLNIHVDGWAGVSFSQALVEPLVEKTLLQFENIKRVKFSPAPGDNIEQIYSDWLANHRPPEIPAQ